MKIPTLNELRATAKAKGFTVRKFDGEYRLNLKGASEESAYYTNDPTDVLGTMTIWASREAERLAHEARDQRMATPGYVKE